MSAGLWNEFVYVGLLRAGRTFVNIGLAPPRESGPQAVQRETYATLADFVKRHGKAEGDCLEICAGLGGGIGILESMAPWRVTGVDASRLAVNRARARGADVRRARLEKLPFRSGQFDHVCGIESLIALDDPGKCLAEVARVLRPGGALSIAEFRKAKIDKSEKFIRRIAEEAGLRLVAFEDITARAKASVLDTVAEREAIVVSIPWPFRKAAFDMSALPGTSRYEEWASGKRCYYLARIEKPIE